MNVLVVNVTLFWVWISLSYSLQTSDSVKTLSCSSRAREFTEFHRFGRLKGACASGCLISNGKVKGSQIYTDDSSICKAAIHAGATNNNGGAVTIIRQPGRKYYSSTVHNGITSSHSDIWIHSYSFEFESTACVRPLGLRNNRVPDRNFKASSTDRTWSGIRWQPWLARLDKASLVNAWRPSNDNRRQWWEVDLGGVYDVRGIVTQGSSRYGTEQYITSFKIQHRLTRDLYWLYALDERGMEKVFKGNSNDDGRVTNNFAPSFTARYLRLLPWTWKNHISLRAEILVCPL